MSHPRYKKEKFIELKAFGLSFDKIAAAINVSKPTLLKWSQEFEKEIAAEEYIKAEALVQKHRLYRQTRFEDAVEELARIRAAIKSKDLSKVNITVLLEMEKQHKEEIATMVADLRKYAGLNRDGQKREVTQAEIDEMLHKYLGVPIPPRIESERKKDNSKSALNQN